jgi:hypothetical protein
MKQPVTLCSVVLTRDNVPMTVDAVVYFRVIDPASAVLRVEKIPEFRCPRASFLSAQPRPLRTDRSKTIFPALLNSSRDKTGRRLIRCIWIGHTTLFPFGYQRRMPDEFRNVDCRHNCSPLILSICRRKPSRPLFLQ